MESQNLVISFDYSWLLAKNLAYAECLIMKFHYRNSSNVESLFYVVFPDSYFWLFAGLPNPNYDYSGDDYQYNDDNELVNEEEEMEMQYDINFLNIGNSQIVDKGTTIKLPCNDDMYPGRLQITTFSAVVPEVVSKNLKL